MNPSSPSHSRCASGIVAACSNLRRSRTGVEKGSRRPGRSGDNRLADLPDQMGQRKVGAVGRLRHRIVDSHHVGDLLCVDRAQRETDRWFSLRPTGRIEVLDNLASDWITGVDREPQAEAFEPRCGGAHAPSTIPAADFARPTTHGPPTEISDEVLPPSTRYADGVPCPSKIGNLPSNTAAPVRPAPSSS